MRRPRAERCVLPPLCPRRRALPCRRSGGGPRSDTPRTKKNPLANGNTDPSPSLSPSRAQAPAAKPAARKPDLDKANKLAESAASLAGEFKNSQRALQAVTEALSVRPKIARWYATRAQIYRALGKNQLAFYDMNAAIRLEPRTWQYYGSRAVVLRKLRRYGDALADLHTALEGTADTAAAANGLSSSTSSSSSSSSSSNPAALFRFYRGAVLMHMEDYPSAIVDLSVSIQPGEKHASKARLLRAACYERLGRTADALADLRRITQTASGDPSNNPTGYNALGIALCELGRYAEAVDLFAAAADRAGANTLLASRALDNKAWAEFRVGRFRAGMETVSMAITVGGEERAADPGPILHRGALFLALGQPLKGLPDLVRACELTEAAVRKEARKAARNVALGGGGGGGGGHGGEDGSHSPGGSGGHSPRRKPATPGGGSSPRRGHGAAAASSFDQLAPELAAALGEPMPPMGSTSSSSAASPGGFGGGGGGSFGSSFGGSGALSPSAAAAAAAAAAEDDTDSDTYTDAVREFEMTMAETGRKRPGDSSPSKGASQAAGASGAGAGSTSPGKGSRPDSSGRAGATGGGLDGGGGLDDKSDTESVRSGSTSAAMRAARRTPAARNLGRGGQRGKVPSLSNQPKPWSVIPSWAKEKPWPEQPGAFSQPPSRALAAAAARAQSYLALCYEQLGHWSRALHHFQNALSAWPAFVPAMYHAGLMLHRMKRPADAEALLSALLDSTAQIKEEVEVVPPPSATAIAAAAAAAAAAAEEGDEEGDEEDVGDKTAAAVAAAAARAAAPVPSPVTVAPEVAALWSPAATRMAVIRLGISALELVPPPHPDEPGASGGGAYGSSSSSATAAPATPAADGAEGSAGEGSASPAPEDPTSSSSSPAAGGGDTSGADATSSSSSSSASPTSFVPSAAETPLQAATRRCRARVLRARGLAVQDQSARHLEAIRDLSASLRADPASGPTHFYRALSLIATGRATAAVADCKAAIALGHDTAAVRDLMGQGYAHLGKYREAVAEFTSALRLAHNTPAYLARRAEAHVALGDVQAGIVDVTNALLQQRNDSGLLAQRADAHYLANAWESALEDFRSALAAGPATVADAASLHYRIGLALANSDKYADAIAAFTASLAVLEPVCGTSRRALASRGFLAGPGTGGGSGTDGDTEGEGARRGGGGGGVGGGMSKSLASALATAALRVDGPRVRSFEGVGGGDDDDDDDLDEAQHEAARQRLVEQALSGAPSSTTRGAPLGGAVGAALRGIATTTGSGAGVKGSMGGWAHRAKVASTPGVSSAALREAAALAGVEEDAGGGPRRARARERYLAAVAAANAAAPLDLVRLRIDAVHERAKARQMVALHRDAVNDFTDVLVSCPESAHALFRRAVSHKALGDFSAASEDFESARHLAPPALKPAMSLNYVGLGDVGAVVLCAAGEEPRYPVLGVAEVGKGK